MPSKSLKQHNLMKKVAASKAFSDKVGIKQSVAREFLEADKKQGKYQYPKVSTETPGWYQVEGYPYFLANKEGKVKNQKTGYETYGSLDDKGYRRVCQWDNDNKTKKEYKAHHVVCTAFHGPCPGPEYEVGHKDHDRSNNAPNNLHWITRKSNMEIANKRRVSTESEALDSAYVMRELDKASKDTLVAFQKELGLKKPVSPDDLHLTLLYSENNGVEDYEAPNNTLVSVGPWRLRRLGEDEEVIAIELVDDEDIQERHKELLEKGGRHSYPALLAHVTLSYNDEVTKAQEGSVDWETERYLSFINESLEPLEDDYPVESTESAVNGAFFSGTQVPASLLW